MKALNILTQKNPPGFFSAKELKENYESGSLRQRSTWEGQFLTRSRSPTLCWCSVIRASQFSYEWKNMVISLKNSNGSKLFTLLNRCKNLLSSSERYWEGNYCIFMSRFSQYMVQGKILCSKAALIFFWILHFLRNTRSHFQLECLWKVGRDWSFIS